MDEIRQTIPQEEFELLEKGELDVQKYYKKTAQDVPMTSTDRGFGILDENSPTNRTPQVYKAGGRFIEITMTGRPNYE
jgi:hypothetical protein